MADKEMRLSSARVAAAEAAVLCPFCGRSASLWNAATGASLGTITDPAGDGVTSLAFDDTYDELAVADKNGTTSVWTLADQHPGMM